MTRPGLSGLVLSAVLLSAAGQIRGAEAHPHIWIDTRAEVEFDQQGRVSEIRHSWTFDDAFSVFVIQGLDEDQDGLYTRQELESLAKVNVESLEEYEFFTFMGVEVADVDFSDPTDYWLDFDADLSRLTLNFTLPLKRPAAVNEKLILEVFDPESYVAFAVKEQDSITLASSAPDACSIEVKPAEDMGEEFAAALAELPADQREVPPEFYAVTSQLSNSAIIRCP